MMNNGLNQTDTNDTVKPAWVAALSNEHIDDPMHTSTAKNQFKKYGNKSSLG